MPPPLRDAETPAWKLVIGLVLPSKRHLEESVETNRRMTIVFDTLNNVRRMKDWNPLLPGTPVVVL